MTWLSLRSLRGGLTPVRIVRRFKRDADGVTAVEFGLVALPFFTLLFGIIEVALAFFASQILETATADAARLVLTGQAQAANFNKAAFQQAVCDKARVMLSCSGIAVDVKTVANFGNADTSGPARTSSGAVNYSSMGYNQGNGGDIVVVKVVYEWPIMMPTFGLGFGDLPNGKRLLRATAVFRNEPF
ncbi:TadE/TadG family type IV pilus assembly protein [Phreatobacter stygius]|nr:TadE/TadG family type IV pilus assembly protein [Phreatobacter stygius]